MATKEGYHTQEKKYSKEKIEVNNTLSALSKLNDRFLGSAIVLESPAMLSVKALKVAGFKTNDIFVPNPTFSFRTIKHRHDNTHYLWLSEFLDKYKVDLHESVTIAFLDFMNTLDGCSTNKLNVPREDIIKYFKYKLPADNSILAITLSFRKQGYNEFTKLNALVTGVAEDYGYYVKTLPYGKAYGGSMFYQIFEVHKL